jgi:hypothetical protein
MSVPKGYSAAAVQTFSNAAVTNTAVDVATVPVCQTFLWNLTAYNPGASVAYLQLFPVAASAVVLGTTTPRRIIPMPAGGGGILPDDVPIVIQGAVSCAVTSTATGSGAPASPCVVGCEYLRG